MTRYVAVVGPGAGASADLVGTAVEVGRLLAERGYVVLTGGLGGVMAGAARGAQQARGTSLGLLPGDTRTGANPHQSLTIPTGLGEMRNALLVRAADAVVAVGSSWGTVSEIALAARTGVPVVLIEGLSLFAEIPSGESGTAAPRNADDPRQAVALVDQLLAGTDAAAEGTAYPGEWVLGVDRQRGAWVGALLPVSGQGVARFVSGPDIATVVDRARSVADLAVVAVDVPIGLPDTGPREADRLARQRLGSRASSVFSTPVRDALQAEGYAEAREISIARTGGTSLAAQSYALRAAILDVDAYVRPGTPVPVVEAHPEVSFAQMAGAPLSSRKHDAEGLEARLVVLRLAGIELPPEVDLSRKGIDDLLDAAACAWTAARVARGVAVSLPDPPERFSDGLDAAVRV